MTLFNAFAKTVSAFALGGVLFGASVSVLAHDLYVPKNENNRSKNEKLLKLLGSYSSNQ